MIDVNRLLDLLGSKVSSAVIVSSIMLDFTVNLTTLVVFASGTENAESAMMELGTRYTELMTSKKNLGDEFRILLKNNLKTTLKRVLEDLDG